MKKLLKNYFKQNKFLTTFALQGGLLKFCRHVTVIDQQSYVFCYTKNFYRSNKISFDASQSNSIVNIKILKFYKNT